MSSQTPVAVAAPERPVPEPPKGLRGHPWLTLFSVAIGVMMVALDGTIVAIANPA
ncbi:MFS transporter, partial [Microbispora bryophytorum]